MTTIKVTTWNIKHLHKALAGGTPKEVNRRLAIVREINDIDADVICLIEAPGDLTDLINWVNQAAPDGLGGRYSVPVIEGTQDILNNGPNDVRGALKDLYAMQGTQLTGNQWIWFLVKNDLLNASGNTAFLQDPVVWQSLVGRSRWEVRYWGDMSERNHKHWRHPQVLVLNIDGHRMEFVGIHMKSKINRTSPFDANGDLSPTYVQKAIKARIKLSTEASDLRAYIDGRFGQEPSPLIFVMGDANDGPGKEYFEERFLFFDLLSNIQGDVFFARRFLNHCLFDFDDQLRWTARFRDRIEPQKPPELLLDHILVTQGLVTANSFPRIESEAGFVEHVIHDSTNATISGETSDHRPVSVAVRLS